MAPPGHHLGASNADLRFLSYPQLRDAALAERPADLDTRAAAWAEIYATARDRVDWLRDSTDVLQHWYEGAAADELAARVGRLTSRLEQLRDMAHRAMTVCETAAEQLRKAQGELRLLDVRVPVGTEELHQPDALRIVADLANGYTNLGLALTVPGGSAISTATSQLLDTRTMSEGATPAAGWAGPWPAPLRAERSGILWGQRKSGGTTDRPSRDRSGDRPNTATPAMPGGSDGSAPAPEAPQALAPTTATDLPAPTIASAVAALAPIDPFAEPTPGPATPVFAGVQLRGFSDQPTRDDLLNHRAHARVLAELLVPPVPDGDGHRDAAGPLVITIEAPAGSGKSSLLTMITSELQDRPVSGARCQGHPCWQWLYERYRQRKFTVAAARLMLSGWRRQWVGTALRRLAKPVADDAPIVVGFEPGGHETKEQVRFGLADAIAGAVGTALHPEQAERERYWLAVNGRRYQIRVGVRKRLHGLFTLTTGPLAGILVKFLHVDVTVPLWFAHGVRLTPALVAVIGFLLTAAYTAWRYLRHAASRYIPAAMLGPLPDSDTFDADLRDPQARAGPLMQAQETIWTVLSSARDAGRTVVVVVDDLDRCAPDTTAEVYQAVSQLIGRDYPQTRFLFGYDPEEVATRLDLVYGADRSGNDVGLGVGWSYLRKLSQLTVVVPRLVNPADFVESLLRPVRPDRPAAPNIRATGQRPAMTPVPVPGPVSDAPIHPLENHPAVRSTMLRWADTRPWLDGPRDYKRIITTWQCYVRLAEARYPLPGQAAIARARDLVWLAEFAVRWPAHLSRLRATGPVESGLRALAEAADSDVGWPATLRTLRIGDERFGSGCEQIRTLLRTGVGLVLADLAGQVM